MKLGEAMYRASQEEAQAGSGGDEQGGGSAGTGGSGEEVVDADFEEIPEEERKRSAS
jgi:molecular chaperone DnaK